RRGWERDGSRRYETASAFAADVQNYLNDEPVQACPPSTWYRFRKFARRNKGVLTTGTAIALAVLVALASLVTAVTALAGTNEKTREALGEEKAAKGKLQEVLNREKRTL